ncbi:myc-family transcription factor [Scheffersomyces coipomensis]|uniref:myc-family transcription factor n=1 Tax=Scheffersomyces coipomensis TaxID=1788519 RepID=UPI00315D93F3
MDSSVWNTTFSPGTTGQTPGKSPYYHDPQQQQQLQQLQQQQQQQHDSSTHHSTPSSLPFQSNPLPPHLNSTTTPTSNFTDSEQMFLHQLEQNLYEAAAVHHHHHHHHHHHDPSNTQSDDTTPNSHIETNSNNGSNNNASTSNNNNSHSNPSSSTSSQNHIQLLGGQSSSNNIHQHRLLQSGGNVPPPPPPHQYEFGIENINFIIPEDLNFDTDPNHESSAFPPSNLPPTQTPSLLAINKSTPSSSSAGPTSNPNSVNNNNSSTASTTNSNNNDDKLFASPILPGQNEKSYNNQHYYHKQKLTEHHQAPQQHVRPDAVFTPLVSPAVTPLDSQVKSGVASNSNSSSSYSQQPPVSIAFEPLTSPALNAQPSIIANNNGNNNTNNNNNNNSADRRRSSSSVFGPVDETPATLTSTVYKRRTPHGTPILQGKPSSIKQSPSLKAKNGGSTYRNANTSGNSNNFENLPESSLESTHDMLPPSSKRNDLQLGNNGNGNGNGNVNNGSGTPLMGFTMGILAEHSQHEDEGSLLNDDDDDDDDEGDADDDNIDMESNMIKPSISRKSSTRSRKSNSSFNSNKLVSKSSSSTETSPKLKASGGSSSSLSKKNFEKPATKKASHKLAEQGRRNRMNMAVHELGNLIPQAYHDEVTIPSKATTVELASKYIRALLNEVEDLKSKN